MPAVVWSQNSSSTEAGAYARKSVTYINALWLMDESVRGLHPRQVGYILDKVKQGISMPRFDYNPVPDSLLREFYRAGKRGPVSICKRGHSTAGGTDPMLDSISPRSWSARSSRRFVAVVDLNKEMRAAGLTSEQQRNSFIADKAKTLGITMEDVEKVMNSAYIYIPLIRGYTSQLKDSSYSTGFAAGIIWFRISAQGEKAHAIPVVKTFTYSSGFSVRDRNYATEAGMVGYKEFAFRAAVKNAARNLVVATQQIPDFRLSGQVIDKGFMGVGFNLGRREGVRVDDKYQIVEISGRFYGQPNDKEIRMGDGHLGRRFHFKTRVQIKGADHRRKPVCGCGAQRVPALAGRFANRRPHVCLYGNRR